MQKTIVGTAMAIAVAGLVLTGCGSSNDNSGNGMTMTSGAAPASATMQHNAADVTFAQEMIPHHRQAVDMAGLATTRASNAQVKDLAGRIEQAQDPEIQQMTTWLNQWGATSSTAMPSMSGMDHGSMPSSASGMPGMMSDSDLQKLHQASGTEFDKMFLQMMVAHHQGAVEMAKTELAAGSNADAKALAQRIIDSQSAEITEMQQLLTTL